MIDYVKLFVWLGVIVLCLAFWYGVWVVVVLCLTSHTFFMIFSTLSAFFLFLTFLIGWAIPLFRSQDVSTSE